jgi:AcrR family transcriptional regulator
MTTSTPPAGRQAARLDGERSRTRILDAAEQLLAEKGFSGTGIAAISRASGLPASSIYWFFASKRDLMLAVIERGGDRALTEFEQAADPGDSPSLRGLFEQGLANFGSRLPDFLRLRILLGLERGDADADLRERLGGMTERINRLAANAIAGPSSSHPSDESRRVAEEVAPLAIAFVNGALVSREFEPDDIDVERLPEELEVAIMAIVEHRLAQEGR